MQPGKNAKTPSDDVVTNYAEEHDLLKTARIWQWAENFAVETNSLINLIIPYHFSSFRIGSACSAHWLLNASFSRTSKGASAGYALQTCDSRGHWDCTVNLCKSPENMNEYERMILNQRSLLEVTVMSLECSYRAPSTWSCSPDFSRKSCVALASSTDCLWPQICLCWGNAFDMFLIVTIPCIPQSLDCKNLVVSHPRLKILSLWKIPTSRYHLNLSRPTSEHPTKA